MAAKNEFLTRIAKAKDAKEIVAVAKSEGKELSKIDAEKLFADIHAGCELTDDMLENVVGGMIFSRIVADVTNLEAAGLL